MNYDEQRQLAAKLLPELAEVIQNENNCFDEIVKAAKPYHDRILSIWSKDWPQEWAWWWVVIMLPKDRERLRKFITESKWAYYWARLFPEDREHMRQFVTESEWAFQWVCYFPEDREHMRQFVRESEWAYWWACRFHEDRAYMKKKFPEAFK